MRIKYNAPRFATFASLRPGEMFRDENNKGLYLKIVPYKDTNCHENKAVAYMIDGDTSGGVKPGDPTGWGQADLVVPVRSIEVGFEELT